MARVTNRRVAGQLHDAIAKIVWNGRSGLQTVRASRAAVVAVGAFFLLTLMGLGYTLKEQTRELENLRVQALLSRSIAPVVTESPADDRTLLAKFEGQLPSYGNIPLILENIFEVAEQQSLHAANAEYKPTVDAQGGFLRYSITMPMTGTAQQIQKFLISSLHEHRTLALKSVQFSREGADARLISARIQWVLYTKPPLPLGSPSVVGTPGT